jgi:hypothetical protein
MSRLQLRILAIALLAIGLVAGGARASDLTGSDRINHQVRSIEKTLDHLMLDSPNFLVQRGRNAHGVYIPDYGLILTFNAAINADNSWVEIFGDDDDSRVVIRSRDRWHRHGNRAVLRLLGVSVGSHGHHDDADDPLELYREGKTELVEMLLDQAGALSSLPTGQWVVVSGSVDDETLREEKKITRLVLRVRTDDLKAYADRKLSDEEATAKIRVEEF